MNYSPEETKQLCQLGRSSLIDFSIITNPKYKPNWHHEEIAKELEAAERGEADWKILILMVPPRHGKSEEATINFPAFALGRKPDREIIIASYSSDLALDFGLKTRDLVNSPIYHTIFPEVNLRADSKEKSKWRTNKNGSSSYIGIGGAATGRGADFFITDDPIKNSEEAESPVMREKQWQWFKTTAFTRLHPGGKFILILTRWHLDDLAGRILKDPEFAKMTKVIKFPAIAIEDEPFRKKGDTLWPTRYGQAEMETTKAVQGIYNWQCLYQQEPVASENQEFKEEWFPKITRAEVDRMDTRRFLTIDTAYSQKEAADSCGFVENYVNSENKWHWAAYNLKITPDDFVEYLFRIQDLRKFEVIAIEETAFIIGLKPFIDAEMRRRGKFLPIVLVKHNQVQKEVRIRGLIPYASSRSIYLIEGECGNKVDGFMAEALTFPKGIHDDILDSGAYQPQVAQKPAPRKKSSTLSNYKPVSEYGG
jgi:hypothetical protein